MPLRAGWTAVARTAAALIAPTAALALAARADEPAKTNAGLPLLYDQDFTSGDKALDDFEFTEPAAWKIDRDAGRNVLSLHAKKSTYRPPVRSPERIAWVKGLKAGEFVMEVKLRSTVADYGHRDLCLFFGGTDASHFYYVHLGKKADAASNSVFLVDGKPRTSIARTRTEGTDWTDGLHTVRVTRRESGEIEVFFDGKSVMKAEDRTFPTGRVGVGSFDDTGNFARITVWGRKAD
jgi:hypothetical protein